MNQPSLQSLQPVLQPQSNEIKFNSSQLENGIKYIIVNDSNLKKSYVTVSVNTGSHLNPKDNELAKFLEHQLFMGSKKYPYENHYHNRLNELGGSSNASTDASTDKMETVYYFSVCDDGLNEILDIFSRFFIDPLFDLDSVSREINGVRRVSTTTALKRVDSEHTKNIQLMLYSTNPDSTPNTLNKPDIRDRDVY